MSLERIALGVLALTLFMLPAQAQDAAELQRKMQQAYQHMTKANEQLKVEETRTEGMALYDRACQLYDEVLDALPAAGLPEDAVKELSTVAHYNIACARSLQGRSDEAFASLEKAIAAGWTDLDHMNKDSDLAPLRGLPRWKKTVEKLETARDSVFVEKAKEALTKGKLFDYSFSVTTLDGKQLKLADLKGKVVIVDYWGTWCAPCKKEIPHLVELQKKYADQLVIVGMTWEHGSGGPDVEAKVKAFAKEFRIDYPLTLITDPTELRKVPNFEGFPTTLFIDKSGAVRVKEVGYRPYPALEALVKGLLAEDGSTPQPAPQPEKKPKKGDDWF